MPTPAGNLDWQPLVDRLDLVAPVVAGHAELVPRARAAAIDPALADTAAFCQAYDVAPENAANCVVVVGRRGGEVRYGAIMVLATMRADVNGVIRRELDVRKCSFAPMDDAVALTEMEYGGITPLGLSPDWPILVDEAVAQAGDVVIGSGIRASKILLAATSLAVLPNARIVRCGYITRSGPAEQ
jgi:prolyl-tRNA editing enzyme YbaK/EbsC (Cys-tRNA(Pro) deacylase)